MNELIAADPSAIANIDVLKTLLTKFGPYAGRYLAEYPGEWQKQVRTNILPPNDGEIVPGELETERALTLLFRRAEEKKILIRQSRLQWDSTGSWLANAKRLLQDRPPPLHAIVASDGDPPKLISMNELWDEPPTTGEPISSPPKEFARVAKILIYIGPEIAVVDQFLNPIRDANAEVLLPIFAAASMTGCSCQRISIWTKAKSVYGDKNAQKVNEDLDSAMLSLVRSSKLPKHVVVEIYLVDSHDFKHARSLVSIHGGVRYDAGFRMPAKGDVNEVSPLDKRLHEMAIESFLEEEGKKKWKVQARTYVDGKIQPVINGRLVIKS